MAVKILQQLQDKYEKKGAPTVYSICFILLAIHFIPGIRQGSSFFIQRASPNLIVIRFTAKYCHMIAFLQNLVAPETNAPQVTALFTKLLKVKISRTTLTKELEEHPDYPSLLSISDVLNNYNIENMAVRLEPAGFAKLHEPFITQIKGKEGVTDFFTVVKAITGEQVTWFDPQKNNWRAQSLASFSAQTTGVVLLADAESAINEQHYQESIRKEKATAILRVATLMALPAVVLLAWVNAFINAGSLAILPVFYSLLLLAGTLVSVLLLWYELDQYNPLLQQMCKPTQKINCSAVLQSKGSKIFGISWSAVGFTYFSGAQLLMLFGGIMNPLLLPILGYMSVAALLYTVFSIYYQWRIAQQWCLLCLVVQGILVLQSIVVLTGGWLSFSSLYFTVSGLLLPIVLTFALPAIALAVVMPALKKGKENKDKAVELQRLKHDPKIFEALLSKQKAIVQQPEGMGIVLGSPQPTHTIVKVCNPYCGPCAKAHVQLEELLRHHPHLQLRIIFMVTSNDSRTPPARHLMAIAQSAPGEVLVKEALNDWYLSEIKDYQSFSALYPLNGELKMQDAKLDAMYNWCTEHAIAYTPTIFIDGYQLPSIYTVSDLKYLLSVSS